MGRLQIKVHSNALNIIGVKKMTVSGNLSKNNLGLICDFRRYLKPSLHALNCSPAITNLQCELDEQVDQLNSPPMKSDADA